MPTKLLWLLLVSGLLLCAGKANAMQSSADESFERAKLAIWCESISFIYQDNGADSLTRRLDCNNWELFRQSLQPNYLQANAFFQAIEKPEIYAGYSTSEAKLSKLVEEIGKRLKASSVRQNNSSRQQAVDSLLAELYQLAQNPALFSDGEVVQGERPLRHENAQQAGNAAQEEAAAEDTKEGWFSWSELLQWLLLGIVLAAIAALWIENKKLRREVGIRMERRKQEIAGLAQRNVKKIQSEPQLNKGLSRSEVLQLIRSEHEKLQKQLRAAAKPKEESQLRAENKNSVQPEPLSQTEPVIPPAAATDKLSPERNGEQASPGIYYDKLPFKGGFHHNQLSKQRHADSIYSIEVLGQKPDEAEFWVTEDADIQKYAMENGLSFFEEACEYDQVEENPSRVRNLEKGRLRKKGHLWQIEKKVKVSFE